MVKLLGHIPAAPLMGGIYMDIRELVTSSPEAIMISVALAMALMLGLIMMVISATRKMLRTGRQRQARRDHERKLQAPGADGLGVGFMTQARDWERRISASAGGAHHLHHHSTRPGPSAPNLRMRRP